MKRISEIDLKAFEKQNGITLLTLIITIIIMLILVGVAISALTNDGGLFKSTQMAKETYESSNEKEVIYIKTLYGKIDFQFDKDNSHYLGKQLYDRNVANGNIWNIVYDKTSDTVYGTNWNYIEKGTYIEDYGNTKSAWLLNPNTLEIVMLEEENYTELSYNTSLGVAENLIFNLDASIIGNSTVENVAEKLGENVELVNFDLNDSNSGLTPISFKLDGVNDYIKVQYDNVEEKEILKENGFTFEFYGILNKGVMYDANNVPIDEQYYNGIFCYWNGIENRQAHFRFGIRDDTSIFWNAASVENEYSDFSLEAWNILYPFDEDLYNKELYFTITVDVANEYENEGKIYYPQTLYVNGEKLYEGGYNKLQWDEFKANVADLNFFCIGRSSMKKRGWWAYTKMDAYAIRLYNRALSQAEVLDNYNKSVTYHRLME